MVKNLPDNASDMCLIPGSRRFLEENGNPLQYSCLEDLMDRGAWGLQSGLQREVTERLSKHTHKNNKQLSSLLMISE